MLSATSITKSYGGFASEDSWCPLNSRYCPSEREKYWKNWEESSESEQGLEVNRTEDETTLEAVRQWRGAERGERWLPKDKDGRKKG